MVPASFFFPLPPFSSHDLWLPDIRPSTALRQSFTHDPARWTEFSARGKAKAARQQGSIIAGG
jgi:uncharacterized protein YeaO (DUF488 family)